MSDHDDRLHASSLVLPTYKLASICRLICKDGLQPGQVSDLGNMGMHLSVAGCREIPSCCLSYIFSFLPFPSLFSCAAYEAPHGLVLFWGVVFLLYLISLSLSVYFLFSELDPNASSACLELFLFKVNETLPVIHHDIVSGLLSHPAG